MAIIGRNGQQTEHLRTGPTSTPVKSEFLVLQINRILSETTKGIHGD